MPEAVLVGRRITVRDCQSHPDRPVGRSLEPLDLMARDDIGIDTERGCQVDIERGRLPTGAGPPLGDLDRRAPDDVRIRGDGLPDGPVDGDVVAAPGRAFSDGPAVLLGSHEASASEHQG